MGGAKALLEREPELDGIVALLERAAGGSGSMAVIAGPAGVGKTSLLRAARPIAEDRGFRCFEARAGELESTLAFGVVRDLFERSLVELHAEGRAELFKGAARLAAPVLSIELGDDQPAPAPGPADAAFAALHGLYWLCANLAQGAPLLLAVDDAHWADAASLRFLAYLGRRVEELPLVVLIAMRPPEPGSEAELLDALGASPGARHISPAPLSESATEELLRAGLESEPGAEFRRAFWESTGGNPFLVTSLLSSLRSEGVEPNTAAVGELDRLGASEVGRSVQARLRRLPAASTSLAQAVAVLGSNTELRLAAGLAGLEEGEASAAADALAGQEILREGRPLEFVHPVVRGATYEALPHGERAAAHGRAARLLDGEGASAELVAPHLLAADPAGDAWVVERLRTAAGTALARGAPEAAVEPLRRALAEPPTSETRPPLLRELGGAEYLVGEPAGVDRLQEALESATTPEASGQVARELTRALLPQGRFTKATEMLERETERLGEEHRELGLELEAELATAGRLHPSTQPATAARLKLLRGTVDGRTPAERLLLASLSFELALSGGTADEVAELGELALDGGLVAEQGPDAPAVADVAVALIMAERFDRIETALDEALAEARSRGSMIGFAVASAFRSLLAVRRGAVVEAEGEGKSAVEAATEAGWMALVLMGRAFLVEALVERGELNAAREALGPEGEGELPDVLMLNFLLYARARLRLASGEIDPGLADLSELSRRETSLGWQNPSRFPHRSEAALALAQLGRSDEAERLAGEELEHARAWGAPRAIGVALRAVGLVEGGNQGLESLRESVDTLERSGGHLEHARALVDLGAALRRTKRRRECREPLSAGMDLAHHCGARPLAERAAEELRASGVRPRRTALSGVESLTASERRVARMAAEGMTNREIAEALFVTMRTVEVHLTSTYRKLDIASREELPVALLADEPDG